MSKIKIISEQTESGTTCTKIFVDGNQLKGVRAMCFKQDQDTRIPILTIDLLAVDMTIDSPLLRMEQKGMGEIKKIEFENGFVFEQKR